MNLFEKNVAVVQTHYGSALVIFMVYVYISCTANEHVNMTYLNCACRERYEDTIEHRNHVHSLSSCENIQATVITRARGFIKSQAPHKLTSCEDDFAHMV